MAESTLDYSLTYLDRRGAVNSTVKLRDLVNASYGEDALSVTMNITHEFPLNFAFHRALFASDVLTLNSSATIERHSNLYLQ